MFARIKKSGKYQYLQIVENRKKKGKVKQRVISTIGRLDQLIGPFLQGCLSVIHELDGNKVWKTCNGFAEKGCGRITLPFCHIAHETRSKIKDDHPGFQLPMPYIGFPPSLTSISQPFE